MIRTNIGLKKVKKPIKTYKITSFDIETHGIGNNFLLGGYNNGKYHSFDDPISMIEYMSKNNTGICYATNLMFDFHALYERDVKYRDAKLLLRGGTLISCKHRGITFSDSYNYAKYSVQALGRMLNLPKLNTPKFIGEKYKTKNEKLYLKRYNARDCLVTKTFMENFQKVINDLGGELKVTIASCALDLYKRKYIPCTIYKEFIYKFKDQEIVKDFIYKAYYGGRTEVFKRGSTPSLQDKYKCKLEQYYMYDVNSLYPSVMRNEYPLPSSARIHDVPSIDYIHKYHGVSEITVVAPYMYYPILPFRLGGKLIFPIGRFRGVYNHIEIRKSLELGYKIETIHKQIYYTRTFYPFKDYVNDLYALRLQYQAEGNGIYSSVVKLLLNSLYGKFALKHLSEYEYVDYDSENQIGVRFNDNGVGYRETPKECNQPYVIPILSSYTTSYARLVLYDHLVNLNGIYCDTDSIISTKKIESSKELGGLKIEKVFTKFNIVKPKEYYILNDLDNQYYIKIKGIRLSKEPLNDFENAINGIAIEQNRFLKLKESIRTNQKVNSRVKLFKKLDNTDNKRYWCSPYNKYELQDSKPFILEFDINSLNDYFY